MGDVSRRELRPCDVCGKPVALQTRAGQRLDFYQVQVTQQLVDLQAVREHLGLALVFGGHEQLADVFAPSDAIGKAVWSASLLVCGPCWGEQQAQLLAASERLSKAVDRG